SSASCPWPNSSGDQACQPHYDESRNQTIDAIEQTALDRNAQAAILQADASLGGRLQQVTCLSDCRDADPHQYQRDGVAAIERQATGSADDGRQAHATEQTRPSLAGADGRRKFCSACENTQKIGTDVGRPNAGDDPKHRLPAKSRLMSQPQQDRD